MIRGIRRRFIRIALIVLALAMVLVTGIINAANWINVRSELWETMEALGENGAQTGKNEKISAMIVNADGLVTYYGALCDAEAGDNKVTVDVRGKLRDGD